MTTLEAALMLFVAAAIYLIINKEHFTFQESGSMIITTTTEAYNKEISKAVKVYTDDEGVVHIIHNKRTFKMPCFNGDKRLQKYKEPVKATIHIIIE